MSSVPDRLDPHDIAVAAHDTGAAALAALLKDAGLDITANRWMPGDYFEANPSPYTLSGLHHVTDHYGRRIYI